MKNKRDIMCDVSNLSETEKSKILKTGKIYGLLLALVSVPVFFYVVFNFLRILDVEKNQLIAHDLMRNNIIALAGVMVYIIVSLVFVKIKIPFYSDKKYKYLKKKL